MSVIGSALERRDQRQGSEDKAGVRTYSRVFLVKTNNKQDGAQAVLAAPALPQLFDAYQTETELDSAAICVGRRPNQIDEKVWEVRIRYSSSQEDNETDTPETSDPLDLQPLITMGFETFQVPLEGAIDADAGPGDPNLGDAIVNSANEPFDPPPMKDQSRPILSITINLPRFDIEEAKTYQDALNNDPFFGADQRQWKMMGITTSGRTKATTGGLDVFYFPISYTMAFNRETWDFFILDRGTFFIDGNGDKRAFKTAGGEPFVGLLDGAGGALADGADPEFLKFDIYNLENFGALAAPRGLPQDFNTFIRV